MKKFIASLLAIFMLFSFAACGDDNSQNHVEEETKKDYISIDDIVVIEEESSYAIAV